MGGRYYFNCIKCLVRFKLVRPWGMFELKYMRVVFISGDKSAQNRPFSICDFSAAAAKTNSEVHWTVNQ